MTRITLVLILVARLLACDSAGETATEERRDKPTDRAAVAEDGQAAPQEARMPVERRLRRQRRGRGPVEVRDPARFANTQAKKLYSGPQPGEKLPALSVIGLRGDGKDKAFDPVADADGKPQVLIFQDANGVGLRGLIGFARMAGAAMEKSNSPLQFTTIFLADDPAQVTQFVRNAEQYLPDFINMGISDDGRDGPGAYGLDRNVSMTILIAKDGRVSHNFAFPQSMLTPDPHVLGALAAVMGESRETMADWLTAAQQEQAAKRESMAMAAGGERGRRAKLRERLRALVEAGKLTRKEAAELLSVAFPER